jgi:hypothetical protein
MARKWWVLAASLTAALVLAASYGVIAYRQAFRTVADSDYSPHIAEAHYKSYRPRILFDAGHHNHHKLDGTYRPFRELLTADGASISPIEGAMTPAALEGADLLVIVTASSQPDPGNQPAFTAEEIDAIREFVKQGKSLLLVVDHFPFGDANRQLAAAFGFDLSGGMTFDPEHYDKASADDSQLVFSRANGLLGTHPINDGASASERVDAVTIFSGTSVSVPPGAVALLKLSERAEDRAADYRVEREGNDIRTTVTYGKPVPAGGRAMGIAMEFGGGRVVALGESAMLTSQYDRARKRRYGFATPGYDNERFARNLVHWLVPKP